MRDKHFQAKHIEDSAVLSVITILIDAQWEREKLYAPLSTLSLPRKEYITASRWDIIEAFKPIPWKIINTKLSSMVRRGLIDGCAGCTCRGGFRVEEVPHGKEEVVQTSS